MLRLIFAALAALAVGVGLYWLLSKPGAPEPSREEPAEAAKETTTAASLSTAAKTEPKREAKAPDTRSLKAPPKSLDAAIREASEALPLAADLRKLPAEELHRTPEPVRKAAWAIGAVAEAVEREPARAGEALAFYGECARRAGVATSTQALCLSSMRELSKTSGIPAVEDGVSAEAKRIADFTMAR